MAGDLINSLRIMPYVTVCNGAVQHVFCAAFFIALHQAASRFIALPDVCLLIRELDKMQKLLYKYTVVNFNNDLNTKMMGQKVKKSKTASTLPSKYLNTL